jgi:Protein of unknown function (DUF3106)
MSCQRQFIFLLTVLGALWVRAQNPPTAPMPVLPSAINPVPPLPQIQSPVNFFRQLLAMSPGERNLSLSNRPPEIRTRILAKVREYQSLPPDERELRLRATELRWWLTPLLRLTGAEREARLAQVPEDLRGIVRSRLTQWDIFPPALQQELLTNSPTLHYFARVDLTDTAAASPEQQKISEQFNRFFELTPQEKQQAINTLSPAERTQMENTLKTFEQLPATQRRQCLHNYARFAGMSAAERAEFLKNAESWAKLSPQERQTWRDLVAQIPILPPLPTPTPPPLPDNLLPPLPLKISRPSVATN